MKSEERVQVEPAGHIRISHAMQTALPHVLLARSSSSTEDLIIVIHLSLHFICPMLGKVGLGLTENG